ncbi:MAG: phosphoglycerate dehydrogenase, partial [Thermomicrobiales bacterium]|nr:phosphoglycerate dehydrogenase [Thermomicrobiales bacterium]
MAAEQFRLAIDLDGVLTEHPRPLAHAASARFGVEMPESAFVDSAGLNVPEQVRDWVYGPDGPAARLQPDPAAARFLRRAIDLVGIENIAIVTARPETSADMTRAWLREHGFPESPIIFADLKAAVALRSGFSHAVEDSLRHARNYAAAGISCFLVKAGDLGRDASDPHITPADDLDALFDMIAAHIAQRGGDAMDERPDASEDGRVQTDSAERPVIVVSDAIHPGARDRLAAAATLVDVDGTDLPALLGAVREADALVVRSETQVTEEIIAAAPRLRVVARAGVGVDNIDLEAATRAGVVVLNAPGANATSAAEHTIALLLGVTRQIALADASTRAGRWERKTMRPIDLQGRTVGIVGLGRVGSEVARRLRAFDMRVIAYDPYITPQRFTEVGAAPVDYETLLHSADVVTFHVPETAETLHMLDREAITHLKPTAIVINAARGGVVDESALADALATGRIAGAGVDVFPHEPCVESPLFSLPAAVLTPHIGGSSAEALAAVGKVISTTTLAALRGEAVPNAVNLPAASLHAPELQRLTTAAGAAGRLLAVLEPQLPRAFGVTVRGLVPSDVTEHVVAAALSEALQRWTNLRVTPVNAKLLADERGIRIRVVSGDDEPSRLPDFSFEVVSSEEGTPPHYVTVRWDRSDAAIMEVDGFTLNSPLAGDVLITHHRDQPGVIGAVGTILARHDVNIAGMQVGRHLPRRGGEAIMVLNVD